ncbi:MAG: acyl-CoA dehydrogenase [Spirochaetes bacterium]|nr:MAG: acyl-CoA dehydrogenase [Spirochaetota bacterium]
MKVMINQNEKENLIRGIARKLAIEHALPIAAEIDKTSEFPWETIKVFGENGFLSVLLPESYGGMDGDITALCWIIEEIGRVCGSSSLTVLAHSVGLMPIMIAGSDELKERVYKEVAEKKSLAAFALTEASAGSDAAAMSTVAEKKGDYYIINGTKTFITNGGVAEFYTIFLKTDPSERTKGISCVLIEKDREGLIIGKREDKMGMRASPTTSIILDNVKVPVSNLVGKENEGWPIAMSTLNLSRPAIGALAIGIAQGALDFAIDYANERVQFGQRLRDFQGIQFMLADMASYIEAARALVYHTSALLDQKIYERDKMSAIGVEKLSAMSKCFASDMAMRVTIDAVQILGGYGYIRDFPVERMMRDAKVTQIFEGSNQVQRIVIARSLMRRFST